jgi:hypothetical protein
MQLKRLVTNKEGEIEATWLLTPDQFQLLLNYAIDSLLSRGLISTLDVTPEELVDLQKKLENDAATTLLSQLDKDKLHSA